MNETAPIQTTVNRFYNIRGDVAIQLAPWVTKACGYAAGEAWFELAAALRFRSEIAGGVVVVPVLFQSNLASIPRFAWSIFMRPDDPRIELGSWVHDYLYAHGGHIFLDDGREVRLTREQCDRILCDECMVELGANGFQRGATYRALRLFGGKQFNHQG